MFLNVINTLSLGVLAVSAAVIAVQLTGIALHLRAVSRSFVLLIGHLKRIAGPDPDPGHHETALPASSLVVWEWRDGSWALRPESGPLESAGSPPDRAGKFDGECVTRRKANG